MDLTVLQLVNNILDVASATPKIAMFFFMLILIFFDDVKSYTNQVPKSF